MSVALRIGDVAKLVGTTPRTIRYYEEIGLLPPAPSRPSGGHRVYTEAEVERLREVMRLKDLLGVTLEELKTLLAAEEARAIVRARLRQDELAPAHRRELLTEALGHIDRQLELVDHRAAELSKLKRELGDTRKRVRRKICELGPQAGGSQAGDSKAGGSQAGGSQTGASQTGGHRTGGSRAPSADSYPSQLSTGRRG